MKKIYFIILAVAAMTMTSCKKMLEELGEDLNTGLMAQLVVDMRGLDVEKCDSIMKANDFKAKGELREVGVTTWECESLGTIKRTTSMTGNTSLTALASYEDYNTTCARMWLTSLYGVASVKATFSGMIGNNKVDTYEEIRSEINTPHEYLQAKYTEGDSQVELRINYVDGKYEYLFRLNN